MQKGLLYFETAINLLFYAYQGQIKGGPGNNSETTTFQRTNLFVPLFASKQNQVPNNHSKVKENSDILMDPTPPFCWNCNAKLNVEISKSLCKCIKNLVHSINYSNQPDHYLCLTKYLIYASKNESIIATEYLQILWLKSELEAISTAIMFSFESFEDFSLVQNVLNHYPTTFDLQKVDNIPMNIILKRPKLGFKILKYDLKIDFFNKVEKELISLSRLDDEEFLERLQNAEFADDSFFNLSTYLIKTVAIVLRTKRNGFIAFNRSTTFTNVPLEDYYYKLIDNIFFNSYSILEERISKNNPNFKSPAADGFFRIVFSRYAIDELGNNDYSGLGKYHALLCFLLQANFASIFNNFRDYGILEFLKKAVKFKKTSYFFFNPSIYHLNRKFGNRCAMQIFKNLCVNYFGFSKETENSFISFINFIFDLSFNFTFRNIVELIQISYIFEESKKYPIFSKAACIIIYEILKKYAPAIKDPELRGLFRLLITYNMNGDGKEYLLGSIHLALQNCTTSDENIKEILNDEIDKVYFERPFFLLHYMLHFKPKPNPEIFESLYNKIIPLSTSEKTMEIVKYYETPGFTLLMHSHLINAMRYIHFYPTYYFFKNQFLLLFEENRNDINIYFETFLDIFLDFINFINFLKFPQENNHFSKILEAQSDSDCSSDNDHTEIFSQSSYVLEIENRFSSINKIDSSSISLGAKLALINVLLSNISKRTCSTKIMKYYISVLLPHDDVCENLKDQVSKLSEIDFLKLYKTVCNYQNENTSSKELTRFFNYYVSEEKAAWIALYTFDNGMKYSELWSKMSEYRLSPAIDCGFLYAILFKWATDNSFTSIEGKVLHIRNLLEMIFNPGNDDKFAVPGWAKSAIHVFLIKLSENLKNHYEFNFSNLSKSFIFEYERFELQIRKIINDYINNPGSSHPCLFLNFDWIMRIISIFLQISDWEVSKNNKR